MDEELKPSGPLFQTCLQQQQRQPESKRGKYSIVIVVFCVFYLSPPRNLYINKEEPKRKQKHVIATWRLSTHFREGNISHKPMAVVYH